MYIQMLAAPLATPWMTATSTRTRLCCEALGIALCCLDEAPIGSEHHAYRGPTMCPLLVLDRRAESMPVWLLCMQPHPSRSPWHLFFGRRSTTCAENAIPGCCPSHNTRPSHVPSAVTLRPGCGLIRRAQFARHQGPSGHLASGLA